MDFVSWGIYIGKGLLQTGLTHLVLFFVKNGTFNLCQWNFSWDFIICLSFLLYTPSPFFIPLSNGVKNYLQRIHKIWLFCSQFSGRNAPWEKKSNQVLFHILPTTISNQITYITGPRVKKVSFTIQLKCYRCKVLWYYIKEI